jgi:hypothetical protein
MRHNKQPYQTGNILAAILMVITLLWLTVSIPFVYEAGQQQEAYSQTSNTDDELPDTEDSPLGNTTEEKTESGSTTLSEYLHHIDELSDPAGTSYKHNCSHDVAVYVAFHGEMLCPPPNTTRS